VSAADRSGHTLAIKYKTALLVITSDKPRLFCWNEALIVLLLGRFIVF
jgi:hypothetical protein